MFDRLSIETSSYCNRRCTTCLRQLYPDRDKVKPWFTQNLFPDYMVYDILDQAYEMGHRRTICFNFYNEPMLDKRLPDFGRYAMKLGFSRVMFASNGDYLDEAMAQRLDGCFHFFNISPYDDNSPERLKVIQGWLKETGVRFTNGLHFQVHCFSGDDPYLKELADRRCHNAARNAVINHRGDFLICCQELVPHFDLGNIYDTPLKELWTAKLPLNRTLLRQGRRGYPYCATCYRGSKKEYVEVVSE